MAYLSVAIINVAIIALTGFLFYYTNSLWPLLALLFLMSAGKAKRGD